MIILGLTGSIGMGKSATADLFRAFHIPIYDADKAVHGLMAKNGLAYEDIISGFPDVLDDHENIDRQKLGAIVFKSPEQLKILEGILHPLVRTEEKKFLRRMKYQRKKLVVLDIPLLFESHAENRCDKICVVSAHPLIQRKRVLKRKGMTIEKFHAILQKQMPDREKRKRADYVIQTGDGFRSARLQVKKIISTLSS